MVLFHKNRIPFHQNMGSGQTHSVPYLDWMIGYLVSLLSLGGVLNESGPWLLQFFCILKMIRSCHSVLYMDAAENTNWLLEYVLSHVNKTTLHAYYGKCYVYTGTSYILQLLCIYEANWSLHFSEIITWKTEFKLIDMEGWSTCFPS